MRFSLKSLLTLAWPVILARAAHSVIGLSDALMSAPLGEHALAAVTTGSMNVFSFLILPLGMTFVVQSFSSQLTGQGKHKSAIRYAWYGLGLAVLCEIAGLLMVPLVGPAVGLFQYAPEVDALMREYISIRCLTVGAFIGIEALGNWYGGLSNTRLHMRVGLVVMALNVFGNWLLIEGNLGFPAMGVRGAAIASNIASVVGFILILGVFLRSIGRDAWPDRIQLRWAGFLRLLRFGSPHGINWFVEFAAISLFINVIVAHLGTTVLAAIMVVFSINSVAFMPGFALGSTGAILVGQAIGKNDHADVPGIVHGTAMTAAVWQCAIGAVYVFAPEILIEAFSDGQAATARFVEIGATMLAISAAWQLFDAVAIAFGEALRAAGDTAWTMWARISVAWLVFVPFGVVSVKVFDGGHVAAMCSMVLFLAVLAVVLVLRFRHGAWRAIDLTGDADTLAP